MSTTSLKIDTSVKSILLLTLPISASRLIPELNYLINATFLGRLGVEELGLAGITGVYFLVFAAIGYGLNNALLAIMSRRAGEENRNEIFSTLWHGMILAAILATIFIIITWIFVHPVLDAAGLPTSSSAKAASFINIRILGIIFLYATMMQNAYLISLQQTKYLVIIALVESAFNILLDYGLIFGKFGMPALGFNGAAWASVISEFIGMMTVFALTKWLKISEKFKIKHIFTFSSEKLKLVFIQGLPLMSQLAISCGAWWIFFILINRNYGPTEQAISQSMRNLFGLTGIFTWAFGSTSNTIISNLIGQGRAEEIFYTIRKMSIISFTGIAIIALFLNLFPSFFLSIFGQDEAFVSMGISSVRVVSLALFATCVGVIWLNAVIATGKTKVVFWIEFAGIVSYLIYIFIAVEWMKLPIAGAWMSEWLYWTVMLILSFAYLKYGRWREGLQYY